MNLSSSPLSPPARICDSCGDAIPSTDPIYYGNIGTIYIVMVCESCSLWHSNATFTLGVIDEATYIVKQHAAHLNASAVRHE